MEPLAALLENLLRGVRGVVAEMAGVAALLALAIVIAVAVAWLT